MVPGTRYMYGVVVSGVCRYPVFAQFGTISSVGRSRDRGTLLYGPVLSPPPFFLVIFFFGFGRSHTPPQRTTTILCDGVYIT